MQLNPTYSTTCQSLIYIVAILKFGSSLFQLKHVTPKVIWIYGRCTASFLRNGVKWHGFPTKIEGWRIYSSNIGSQYRIVVACPK